MPDNNFSIDGIFKEISSIEIGLIRKKVFPKHAEEPMKRLIYLFDSGSDKDRNYIYKKVNSKISLVFLWFAKYMAIGGVRTRSEELLRLGITALVIESFTFDKRDSHTPLALLCHSAHVLSCNVEELFREAAKHGKPEVKQFIEEFPSRPAATISLRTFGYKESEAPEEFDYVALNQ